MSKKLNVVLILFFFVFNLTAKSQDSSLMSNSFYGLDIGWMNYKFTGSAMERGYTVSSVSALPIGVRLTLFGYRFNKYLSGFITYMRPVDWVKYHNVNGDGKTHTVWLNYGTFSVSGKFPLAKKLSLNSEVGFVVFTRKGFEIRNEPVVKDAGYTTAILGLGLRYHFSNKWSLVASSSFVPGKSEKKQPSTNFNSLGFRYDMGPRSNETMAEIKKAGHYFPKNIFQIGYTTNRTGYSVNNTVQKYHVFWGGNAEVESGLSARYLHRIFNTKKVFSLYMGADASAWKSDINHDRFYTLSAFPVLNFTVYRTKQSNLYLFYSVAGPTYISKETIDGLDTGEKFTFRDFMGMGMTSGIKQKWNIELSIGHYSNGNFYADNPGIKIPLSLNAGYVF